MTENHTDCQAAILFIITIASKTVGKIVSLTLTRAARVQLWLGTDGILHSNAANLLDFSVPVVLSFESSPVTYPRLQVIERYGTGRQMSLERRSYCVAEQGL
jgi:hypothetical protein